MIRIGALNDDCSKSGDGENAVPKEPSQEVQEENALKLYNEALLDQKNGNYEKAEDTYKQLLSTALLLKIQPEGGRVREKRPDDIQSIYGKPSWMLKYSCLKNLAAISAKREQLDEALDYFSQALDIEGSDVSMWHQSGVIALKLSYMNVALNAFLEGLTCSPRNWLCLDKVIICFFCMGDYIHCLRFIARAFLLDRCYTRGQVLRDHMLEEQPSLASDMKAFYPFLELYFNEKNNAKEEVKGKLLKETLDIRATYHAACVERAKPKERSNVDLPKPLESPSWMCLGQALLSVFEHMTAQETYISLLSPINLKVEFKEESVTQEAEVKEECPAEAGVDKSSPEKPNSSDVEQKDGEVSSPERKSRRNRGSALMEELLWGGKRRSARVRTSLRKDQEPIDVAEALRRILPRKLLHKTKQLKPDPVEELCQLDENSMDTMDLYRLFERQGSAEEQKRKEEMERSGAMQDIDKVADSEGYFGTKMEKADIVEFLEKHDGDVITEILRWFVLALEKHHKKAWPNALPSVYVACYKLMRTHHPVSIEMCTTAEGYLKMMVETGAVLLYGELLLDQLSDKPQEPSKAESYLPHMFLAELMEVADRPYLFPSEEEHFKYLLRLYWLRCHMFLARGATSLAITALNQVLGCYELYPQYLDSAVTRKNCRTHRIVSKAVAENFLAFQSRKRSLVEVVRLYEDERYQELTDILKESFTTAPASSCPGREMENELVDRQTQLSMLINGLYQLNEYKECIYWLETSCYEAMQKVSGCSVFRDYEPESWTEVLDRLLCAIEDCLVLGETTLDEALPPARVSRFTQTLCHVICKQMEDSERPPCPARPWIMLNRILVAVERNVPVSARQDEDSDDEDDDIDIPSSVLVLFTAHDYLGRREWCSHNNNILLFLILDQVIPHMRKDEWALFRQTVQQHLEQVAYCLYSHPSKKSKGRYISEHNVTSIPLTWDRAMQLFQLFRPDETPSFDSLRVNLISSDTEVLFRKIAALIPDENDPVQNSENMTNFIVGNRNDIPEANIKLPELVEDLFYILGDYYFKTHESAKAVNYLLIDLCANPERADSWASMALSKASILEQQLNSCDPIKDDVFLKDALSVLRCYEHCLQLESKQCTLWIEYGSFVYTVHSFCSQRMKLQSESLSLEQFEELETTKNKMLDTAKQAFVNANLIWLESKDEAERQDERWLHHYMLGKICEKHGDLGYFDHYGKAAELLYENYAQYPSKVGYTTPQTLAVEALEVYYRVHACVIKVLELNEGKPLDPKTKSLFSKYVRLCAKGPFAKQLSKSDLEKVKQKEEEAAAEDTKVITDVLSDIITQILEEERKEKVKVDQEESEKEKDETVKEEVMVEELKVKDEAEEQTKMETGDDVLNETTDANDSDCMIVKDTVEEKKILEEPNLEEAPVLEKMDTEVDGKTQVGVDLVSAAAEEICHVPPPTVPNLTYPGYNQYHQQEDNYYFTLDDLRNIHPPPPLPIKKRRRPSAVTVSSSSSGSEDIKYDDESSSSGDSSSSETEESSSSCAKTPDKEPEPETIATKVVEDKGKEAEEEEKEDSEADLLKRSLAAMETCAARFPQHYKSVYRLAHFYYRSKQHKDIEKCKELLLGHYTTPHGTINGLFSERKNTNFFNGIWRIPAGDVDRAGSFAAHMSRSILLLVEVLRDVKDHKMLLELSLQLRKVPEPDKKYLREDERNQLSGQALTLTLQTLRKNVKDTEVMTLPIVLDAYRCYQKVQRHNPAKEAVFGDILLDGFKRLGKGDKCTLEQAVRFCHCEVLASHRATKAAIANPSTPVTVTPKVKVKKQEKKKRGPKPQLTAKLTKQEPKKQAKPEAPLKAVAGSSKYSELLKSAAQDVKKRQTTTTTDQQAAMQMYAEYNQQLSMMLAGSGLLGQYGYSGVDYSEYFKQYASMYSTQLMSNFFNPVPSVSKKPRTKVTQMRPNPFTEAKSKLDVKQTDGKQLPKPETKQLLKPELKQLPKPEIKQLPKPEIKQLPKPEIKQLPKPEIKQLPKQLPRTESYADKPNTVESKPKTFNIDDILAKPSKISKPVPRVLTPNQVNSSFEEKTRSEGQTEAINLSPDRKGSSGVKRCLPEQQPVVSKKLCTGTTKTKDTVEVVTIDD